ncbi:Uncharacterised protein [Shigella sonnei]|nr:Uncharacterised protein [Shigella sonnei]
MLHTLTDQIHFHRRKTSAPVQDGIEHHGQVFVVFIEPAGVIAFLHNQAKAARLAGQQRLTGQFLNGRGQERRQYAAVTVDK